MLFTWWLGHFIPRYLKVHFMLMKQTWDSTLRMRYPLQSTGRPISHRNVWSFLVYMISLRDFVPEWNSRPSTNNLGELTPGYHVNKCRAMRGNRSGLVPAPKSLRCHVNTPLRWRFLCSDWCAHLARLRFPLLFPQENFSFWSDNKSLIDSGLFGQDGWKLALFFFFYVFIGLGFVCVK